MIFDLNLLLTSSQISVLEQGIPSKRESSACVDYIPALCTHRLSLLPIEWFSEACWLALLVLVVVVMLEKGSFNFEKQSDGFLFIFVLNVICIFCILSGLNHLITTKRKMDWNTPSSHFVQSINNYHDFDVYSLSNREKHWCHFGITWILCCLSISGWRVGGGRVMQGGGVGQ